MKNIFISLILIEINFLIYFSNFTFTMQKQPSREKINEPVFEVAQQENSVQNEFSDEVDSLSFEEGFNTSLSSSPPIIYRTDNTFLKFLKHKFFHEADKLATKVSDNFYGAASNVLSELKDHKIDYPVNPIDMGEFSQAVRIEHRIDWAITELVRNNDMENLKLLVEFCNTQKIPINNTPRKLADAVLQQEIAKKSSKAHVTLDSYKGEVKHLQQTQALIKSGGSNSTNNLPNTNG